jgi:hypothetical protein
MHQTALLTTTKATTITPALPLLLLTPCAIRWVVPALVAWFQALAVPLAAAHCVVSACWSSLALLSLPLYVDAQVVVAASSTGATMVPPTISLITNHIISLVTRPTMALAILPIRVVA